MNFIRGSEHDQIRADRAATCNRDDLDALAEAITGLQSTDDPSLVPLHDELMDRYRQLKEYDDERRGP